MINYVKTSSPYNSILSCHIPTYGVQTLTYMHNTSVLGLHVGANGKPFFRFYHGQI